jgi:hypothetical protein
MENPAVGEEKGGEKYFQSGIRRLDFRSEAARR